MTDQRVVPDTFVRNEDFAVRGFWLAIAVVAVGILARVVFGVAKLWLQLAGVMAVVICLVVMLLFIGAELHRLRSESF